MEIAGEKKTTRVIKDKWWIILLVSIIFSIVVEFVQIKTQPFFYMPRSTEEMRSQETTIFPGKETGISGYEQTKEGLTVVAGDPQIYFDVSGNEPYHNLSFYFSTPTTSNLDIQVFYLKDADFNEIDSVKVSIPSGVDYWAVQIPEGQYPQIRIDIDGEFIPLQSIAIGNVEVYKEVIPPSMHILRMIIVAVCAFAVLMWMTWCDTWSKIRSTFANTIQTIKNNGKRNIIYILSFFGIIALSVGCLYLICSVINQEAITSPKLVFALAIGLALASMLIFRNTLKTQPEYIFLVLMVCIGFLYCFYIPHTGINGWDEDYHYTEALKTSYVDSLIITPQDQVTIERYVKPSFDLNGGIQEERKQQDKLFHSGGIEKRTFVHPVSIPELFNGIGLFFGRVFNLSYYLIHFLGRFTGLLTYAFVGFFAIRRLHSGKMIAAVALLIPTEVFIASSYNYDSYLTGFTILGLSYYIAQWQEANKTMTLKDEIIMIGAMFFGCLTKNIVYFPLLWILIMLPKNKFADKKHHQRYVWTLIAVTGLLLISYLLNSAAYASSGKDLLADMRGGSDVNPRGQIEYILHNPLKYCKMIWNYIANEYFGSGRSASILTNMAYHGLMPNHVLYLVLLFSVAFTDKNEYDQELVGHVWAHLWPIIISFAVIVIVITSMYIAYTPVGAEGAQGAQHRYLIPMIFPVLIHCGSGLVKNRMNRGWYNGLVLTVAAYVGFACVYNAAISKYF